MHYTRTAITQLTKMYRSVLKKCAFLNAIILAGVALPSTSWATVVENWAELSAALSGTDDNIEVTANIENANSIASTSNDKTLNVNGNTISGQGSGPAGITVNSGSLTLENGGIFTGFTNNTVNNSIVTLTNAGLTMASGNLTFKDNTADWGALGLTSGAVTSNATLTFDNNTSATHGAGFYYKDQAATAGAIFNGNVTFNDNKILASSTSGSGAGVFVSGGNVSFLGENNTFTNNKMNATIASSRQYKVGGGAIANQSYWNENNHSQAIDATMVIGKDANSVNTFSNNSSLTNGGAIMNRAVDDDGNAYMTINGTSTFSNNSAAASGGAIYNVAHTGRSASVTFNNDATFSGNEAKGTISSMAGVYDFTGQGGAIYNSGGNITFNGETEFSGNKAASAGGAIGNLGGTLTFEDSATFTGNQVTGGDGQGGAVRNASGTINFNDGVTFTGNTSTTSGSAIYNALHYGTPGTVNIKGNALFQENNGNYAIHNVSNDTVDNLVAFSNGDATFKENTGGAIWNQDKMTFTGMGDVLFEGNTQTENSASAISNVGTMTIGANTFTVKENEYSGTNKLGAAIGNTSASSVFDLTANTVEFSDNVGGAIYKENDNFTITANEILFDGNSGSNASAINNNGNTSKTTLTADSITFSGNTSSSSYGGAIFNSGNYVKILGDENTFTGNKANGTTDVEENKIKFGGGAIQNRGNTAQTEIIIGKDANSTNLFDSNTSAMHGGAIHARAEGASNVSTIKLNGTTTFNENIAALNGGAISNSPVAGTANVTINGDSTFTNNQAGDKGGAIYNTGSMTFNKAATFEGNTDSTGANDIYNTGTITFNGDVTLDGGISGDAGNIGSVTFASGTSVNVKANETFIKNNNVTNGGATLNLNLDNGYTGTYVMVDGGTLNNEFTIAENTLYNINTTDTKGTYDVSKKSGAEVAAETGATQNQAAAVTAITNGDGNNATFNAIAENISDLMQSGGAMGVQLALDAAETLAPEVAPVVLQTATENVGQIFSAVSARLSGGAAATASNSQGMSSGDSVFENGAVWVQGLYNHAKLNDTRKAKGYKADSNGLAFGFEKQINDNVKAGIGYAYTKTDVDGHNRDLDIDTHTALVYGEYKPSAWFVNAMASYSWSDYDEDKKVLGRKITGDYDAQSYALQAMTGYELGCDNTIFTPEAGLRYIHVSQDGYKDKAGQYVYGSEVDTLTGVAGLRVEQAYALDNGWTLRPSARFAVTYDIANDDGNSAALLANGTAYTVKGEAMDRFGMEADFALTADITDNASVSLGYQGKFRDDYKDHTGLLNLKYNF